MTTSRQYVYISFDPHSIFFTDVHYIHTYTIIAWKTFVILMHGLQYKRVLFMLVFSQTSKYNNTIYRTKKAVKIMFDKNKF